MSDRPNSRMPVVEAWLSGGGEMGRLIREHDWAATPLGKMESWPQSLKTTLGILLNSRYPMFVFWGPDLVKIYNDAYRPITGRKHPWALGRAGPEVWPEIWPDIEPLVDRALAGDPTWSDDLLLFLERNGFPEETYFTFSYSPVADESGGVGGMFCACTETTTEVLGNRRLRTLRDLASAAADTRTVVDACARSVEALGANAEDLPFALVYLADDSGAFSLCGAAGLSPRDPAGPDVIDEGAANPIWPVEIVTRTGVGRLMGPLDQLVPLVPRGPWPEPPSAAMVLPLMDRGLQRGVGAVVLGLSSRRPFDDDYRQWCGLVATQLGASISNARAAEEERRRAEALAELDRAKTTFFSNVSHEFRTPLTLMLGPLQDVLDSAALGPELRQRLEVAHRNTLRLTKLVNSLLDFSRLEAGRLHASYEPVDLLATTADLVGLFRSAVESAGLELVVDSEPIRDPVFVDREMWEQIVLNLLSNAFKFTFAGRIVVSLRQHGETVELVVSDTGVGIPAEELPHVFERFHQVKNARGRSLEGTGIGLALVQELVKLHGGTVRVESAIDRGTTFRVTLPVGSAHLPPDRIGAARAMPAYGRGDAFVQEARRWLPTGSPNVTRPYGARHARVIVADDNADMRDYLRRILEDRYEVEVVADGVSAMEAIRRRAPDLVLADVMMPGLDGFAVLAAVRREPDTRDVPVVLLSARAGEEARIEGLRAGADDYLVKPFAAKELVARIDSTLELARLRRHGDERLGSLNRELARRVLEQQALLDVLPIGIGIANDVACRDIRVNRAFAAVLGLEKDANASMTAPQGERPTNFRVLSPDGVEVSNEELPMQVAAREGRVVSGLELDVVHDDGRVIQLLEYAAPLYDEHGMPRGAVGAFVDITDRKRAEHALRRSENLFREMADTAPIMLWIADPAGRCTFLSRSWYEFTGQTPETGLDAGWIEAVHAEDRDRTMALYEAAGRRQEPFRLEYRLRAQDGTYRWAIDAAQPRVDEGGQFLGYIGAVIDISDRKEAETALERLYRDLEEANRLKDEFLATLSHELRTPLNAVLGWAQVLRSGPLKPSVQERALDSLERNARAQAQLVEDLLDVSRIMSGKLHIKTEPVNLAAIVTNAVETVRAGVTAKQQNLEIHIEDRERLRVAGDPDRLQQIVWNLVSNAIKFTPNGGRIEIRLRSVGEVAELSVRDNGQGIAASFLPHVFERFRQMDGSTVRRQGGLGLGLSIARHLAEAHGGTVAAESAGPGEGATFYLRLPLQAIAAAEEPARVARAKSVARVLSGIRALVVDDEADARELVEYILEASGAEVVSAASVAEALRLTRAQPFDVLVADIGMPERDGYALIREIRDDPSASVRGLPAVAVTAYASARERRQILDAGYNWHLTKPINPEQLVASVFTALGR